MLAGFNPAPQQGATAVLGVAQAIVQDIQNIDTDVEADEIRQAQRARLNPWIRNRLKKPLPPEIGDERDVNEACSGRHVRDVRDPELVSPGSGPRCLEFQ